MSDYAVIRRFVTLCGCTRDEPATRSEVKRKTWSVPLRFTLRGVGAEDEVDPLDALSIGIREFDFTKEEPRGVFVFTERG